MKSSASPHSHVLGLVLHYTVLWCPVQHCILLYCTALCCPVLHYTTLHCTVLCCIVLYCTVLCCPVLYYTVLYCVIMYCFELYCTILYCAVQYILPAICWTCYLAQCTRYGRCLASDALFIKELYSHESYLTCIIYHSKLVANICKTLDCMFWSILQLHV